MHNVAAPREAEPIATSANQAAIAPDNARLYEQAEELAIVQERRCLARELRDSVTQALYSLGFVIEATRGLLALNQSDRLTTFLGRIADTSQPLLKEMRLLLYELRPAVTARDGKERAQLLGGQLKLSSTAGQGTRVSLELPLPATARNEVKHD